jgi:hypothetical protein
VKEKKHKHGFKVPDNYFDNFEARLFDKINLESLPKDSGFRVPEGYFERFDDRMVQKLFGSENRPKVIRLNSKRTLTYVLAIAACLALIVSVALQKESLVQQLDSLKITSIENYINEGYMDLESYEVMALLNDDDLVNMNIENDIFSEESLETYLMDHDIEETLLIE